MNLCGLTLHARLEQLARSMAGKCSDEGAQRLVTLRTDLGVDGRASVRSMLSPPLALMPSSFGHDTPAHVERRFRFRVLVLQWMGSTECGADASTTDRRRAVAA
jgi:hypothetical protein